MKLHVVLLALALAFLLSGTPAAAQLPVFAEITPELSEYFVNPESEDFWLSSLASADVDSDGDLDLVALGRYVVYNQSGEVRLVFLRNDGMGANGRWLLSPHPIPLGNLGASRTDMSFGDVDADGDPDLVVASAGVMALYRNDAGVLTPTTTELPYYTEQSDGTLAYDLRSITWADSDNDGDLDLLVPSTYDLANSVFLPTQLLRNSGSNGSGGFLLSDSSAGLDITTNAQTNWADEDGDGDLDVLVSHIDTNGKSGFVRIYRNNGSAGFTGADALALRVHHGMTDWADADGDGDLDILVAGNIEEPDTGFSTVLRVYRNQGGSYNTIELALPSPEWLDLYAATWADYDSDGDVDLLITGVVLGDGELTGRSEIYANDGGGNFTALGVQLPAPDTALNGAGAFTWLDLDADGDLDYLVSGAYYIPGGNGLVESRAQVFRNITPASNAPPAAPVSAFATVSGAQVSFSWLAPVDDHTSSTSLAYDLQITRAGASPLNPRRLPQPGSISRTTQWQLKGLAPGAYIWSLQAIDAAYAGGSKASGAFQIGIAEALFSNGFE